MMRIVLALALALGDEIAKCNHQLILSCSHAFGYSCFQTPGVENRLHRTALQRV